MGQDENWAISNELYDFITGMLPQNKTILELGSGRGTGLLANLYEMISIEHDRKFVDQHRSQYIHAPIRPFRKQCAVFPEDKGWYDREVLKKELPKIQYDMILIDGPPNSVGRGGFFKWRELFDMSVPMIFDDVHRGRESRLISRISGYVKRPYTVHAAWTTKHFGVILP